MPPRINGAQRSPDHHLDRGIAIELGSWLNADKSPIAQNRDAVGDPIDLFHSVADEHHRHLARLEFGHDCEEPLHFALGQSRSRLVHDQHFGVDGKGARDLHQLLLGWPEPLQRVLRAAVEPDNRQEIPRSFAHTVIVNAKRAARHVADEDILGYAQIGEKTRMLVHHGNPSALRLERRPVLDGDFLD